MAPAIDFPTREPWDITGEGYLELWTDVGGSPGTHIVNGQFLERAHIKPNFVTVRTDSPGSDPIIESYLDTVTVSLHQVFCRKAQQWLMPAAGTKYYVKFKLINAVYTGVSPQENDTFSMKGCAITSEDLELALQSDAGIDLEFTGTGIE